MQDAKPAGEVSRVSGVPVEEAPRTRALAARLARRIESDIAELGWEVGTLVGSEPSLQSRYGVSREVLRGAIRLLEHHEVAMTRRGPSGGLVVTAPAAGPAIRAMAVYLKYVGATVDDLVAARLLLEPTAARLAAEYLTEEGLHRLRSASADDELHLLLPHLGRNAALALFVEVLVTLAGVSLCESDQRPVERAAEHDSIRGAVIRGSGGVAEQLMAEHVRALQEGTTDQSASEALRSVLGERPGQKLADRVAHRLIEEVIDSRASPGTLVGSEADLAARLDISRAVLREALRIVEYHAVARMRLGPGGGLVVARPDPAPIIETMAIYLDYKRVGAGDVARVRTALELACVDAVVRRRDEDGVAERLKSAAEVSVSAERSSQGKFVRDLHSELAELSGNPILALFLSIVRQLWSRHVEVPAAQISTGGRRSQEDIHRDVVAAILAGDAPLATVLMRSHVEHLPFTTGR